jgi:hypothetical protein
MWADVDLCYNMNDLAEGDLHCGERRGGGGLLFLSSAAVSFQTFTEYYSALWSRFAGVLVGGGGSLIASLMRGYGGMGVWVVMREARFIFYFDDENSWLYSLCIARCVIAGGEQDLGWQLWRGWMWALHTSCSYSTVLVYDLSLLSKSVCPYTCSYVYHHHHHHHHHLRGSSHSAAHLGPRCRLFWFWNIIVGYCRFLFKLRSDLSIFSMDFLDLFYLLDLKRIFRIR